MDRIYKVILPINLNKDFYYLNSEANIGDLVVVPFGKQTKIGLVFAEIKHIDFPHEKLKQISNILVKNLYSKKYRDFMLYFSEYYVAHLNQVLSLILPHKDILNSKVRKKDPIIDPEALNFCKADYSKAQLDALTELKNKATANKFSVNFLHGITGSGKTELYLDLIANLLVEPKSQALILLPEILLTKQFIDKFYKRFSIEPNIWHSSTSQKDKKRIWQALNNDNIRVIIGARSALFLPFKNLKVIILDEEHDVSYKQEEQPAYHARDMAIVKAYKENIPIILASATPSFETYRNAKTGKYNYIQLTERFAGNLPEIDITDLKKECFEKGSWLGAYLKQEITLKLAKKEQVMLFLNRKGYAPLKICTNCGYRFKCQSCDSWLVEHKKTGQLICHHCDFKMPNVTTCPSCKEENKFISYGPGVERIEEEVQKNFPQARIALITSDETKNLNKIKEIFTQIEQNEIDIIIGTQIVSKGHHFKNLNLVGVIDGDIGDITDIRSSEKMYQLLNQISGRAGREGKGKVIIQAYNPNTSFLIAILNNNLEKFYDKELTKREKYKLPPYGKLVALIISSKQKDNAESTAQELAKYLRNIKDINVLGPVAAPMFFLRNQYRYRILLKLRKEQSAADIFKPIKEQLDNLKQVAVKIEVDPINFM